MRGRALVLGLLLLGGMGCKPMLYPLARAFGGASEGELKLRRVAFERFKTVHATARVGVYPAVDPVVPEHPIFPRTIGVGANVLLREGWQGCVSHSEPPPVPSAPLPRNQMRYVENRANAYAAWVKASKPAEDYVIVVEVLGRPSGPFAGMHCYVIEASGQVVYWRLMNSHHFKDHPPQNPAEAVRTMLQRLVEDLKKPADQVWPPYGVG